MAAAQEFDAFVSYSHRHDRDLGPRLQAELQKFAKPWYRPRALRAFLDTANLAANPGLWESIEGALSSSRWFILLASPDAAKSYWVNREVQWWRDHRRADRLLVVATSPGLAWDKDAADWAADAPVPSALRGLFSSEPLWIDLSDIQHDRHAAMVPADRIAAVAAPIRGVQKDALIGEHLRERRRAMRLAQGAIALLATLTALAAAAGAIAIGQRHAAVVQRDAAIRARNIAVADQLASKSQVIGDANPAVSRFLSLAAWKINPSAQARYALVAAAARPGITVLTGGSGPDNPLAFSPGGKLLALLAADGVNVRLWDAATGQPIGRPIISHLGQVNALAFGPGGRLLAVGGGSRDGATGVVRLWDAAAGQWAGHPLVSRHAEIDTLAFSHDGILAAADGVGVVRLWNTAAQRQIARFSYGHNEPNDVAFSPDGKILAVAGLFGTALWNVAARHLIGRLADEYVSSSSVAFSPDGKILATGNPDGRVRLWDTTTLHLIGQLAVGHAREVISVAFRPGGGTTLAVAGSDGTVRLWNVAARRLAGLPTAPTGGVVSVAFSPDGATLAAGSDDGTVRLWNAAALLPAELSAPTRGVASLAFSPGGATLAAGGNDGRVWLWNVATRRRVGVLATGHAGPVSSLAFSPGGMTLAAGGSDGTVRLWKSLTRHTRAITLAYGGSLPVSVTFSPDGKTLAAGDFAVRLWDVATGRQTRQLRAPPDGFTQVAFSPGGEILAVGGGSGADLLRSGIIGTGVVDLWNLATGRPIARLTARSGPVNTIGFSPDGKTLATGDRDGTVRLWNLASHRQIGEPITAPGSVHAVAFSPDGSTLAVGDATGTVRLWDLATRQQIGDTLTGQAPVNAVAFSSDGTTLAVADAGQAVQLWDVSYLTNIHQRLCSLAGNTFTPTLWATYIPHGPAYRKLC